jgi:hypothetical protein
MSYIKVSNSVSRSAGGRLRTYDTYHAYLLLCELGLFAIVLLAVFQQKWRSE